MSSRYESDLLENEKRKIELLKEMLDTFKNIDKSLKKISELVSYDEHNEPCIKIHDSSSSEGKRQKGWVINFKGENQLRLSLFQIGEIEKENKKSLYNMGMSNLLVKHRIGKPIF